MVICKKCRKYARYPVNNKNHICIWINKVVKNLVGLHSMVYPVKLAVSYCTLLCLIVPHCALLARGRNELS